MFILPQSCTGGCSGAVCTRFYGHHWTPSCTDLQSSVCWLHPLSSCLSARHNYKIWHTKFAWWTFIKVMFFSFSCFEPNIWYWFRSRENHPLPVKSELGGVLSRSHEYWLLSGSQPLSSSPSSQSWSPLHTRDWLMHWPAGFSFTVEA